jgi:predicted DNA-binding ribbon-helix-helix protein
MQSPVRKRSIVLNGHKTSISLEDAFFDALKEIAKQRRSTLSNLITGVDQTKMRGNLSSALRLLVLEFYQSRSGASALTVSDTHRRPERSRIDGI